MADAVQYVVATGVIVPDTAELQTAVEGEFRAALGADVVLTPDTPQGALVTAEVLARSGFLANLVALANQINPDQAGGQFLDALWALTGGGRVRATRSLIPSVTLSGEPGTFIQAGALARIGADGPLWQSTGDVTLNSGGSGSSPFQSVDYGPVTASVGELDQIVTGVLGWDTVSNPTSAIPGVAEEQDASARARRRVTLGLQGVALPEAIISGLYNVDGVRSVLFRENYTDDPVTIDTVTLVPHSVYACVSGGSDDDVAAALLAKKSLGADWNGDTEVTVLEPVSGQAYDVKFQRPEIVTIYVTATVKLGDVISDPVELVENAMLTYAAGEMPGEVGFVVGGSVSAFELGGAVNRQTPGLYVQSVTIGTDPSVQSAAAIPIAIDQQAAISAASISVVVVP